MRWIGPPLVNRSRQKSGNGRLPTAGMPGCGGRSSPPILVFSIAFLLGYFTYLQQIDLVLEVATLAAVGLGGFGGGYGFARWRGR